MRGKGASTPRGEVLQGHFAHGRVALRAPGFGGEGANSGARLARAVPGMRMPKLSSRALNGDASTIVSAIDAGTLPTSSLGRPIEARVRETLEEIFNADFSDVRIHEGPAAPAMGASAFTLGNALHFAPNLYDPHSRGGLELLAHELTHVKQQRDGRVKNPGHPGVVIVQDPELEEEADRVGQLVAAHLCPPESAKPSFKYSSVMRFQAAHRVSEASSTAAPDEPALVEPTWPIDDGPPEAAMDRRLSSEWPPEARTGSVLQPKVIVGDSTLWSTLLAWRNIEGQIPSGERLKAYLRLNYWIKPPGTVWLWKVGRVWDGAERKFKTYDQLVAALLGDLRSDGNMARETALAGRLYSNREIIEALKRILKKIRAHGTEQSWDWNKVQNTWRGAYWRWGPTALGGGVKATTTNPYDNIRDNFAAIRMCAYAYGKDGLPTCVQVREDDSYVRKLATDLGSGRTNDQTANEDNLWVRQARELNIPIRVGPSNTMNVIYNMARTVGATKQDTLLLAWAAVVFYNQDYSWIGTAPHTMHEIMDVAEQFTEAGYDASRYAAFLKDPFREKD